MLYFANRQVQGSVISVPMLVQSACQEHAPWQLATYQQAQTMTSPDLCPMPCIVRSMYVLFPYTLCERGAWISGDGLQQCYAEMEDCRMSSVAFFGKEGGKILDVEKRWGLYRQGRVGKINK